MNYTEITQTALIIYLLIRDYKKGKIIHELATETLKIAKKVFNK